MAVSKVFIVILSLILGFNNNCIDGKVSESLKVTLPHGGGLIARHMTSLSGRGIKAFLSVPYAEPPIGDLRFKPPVPKLSWEGFIPAADDKMCVQINGDMRNGAIVGSEDCLYLNVYTPQNPKSQGPLPVMVFFHGGGFTIGSGGMPFYGPQFLLDHDVVLVSGNYRLGPLGFLSTGTADCPGNNGLKDQVAILRWIQDNIETFNGDPGKVTIFGESAGGASVSYHLTSSLSYKLFHRAILQSGTQFSPWAFDFQNINVGNSVKLGELLGCPLSETKDYEELMDCMRQKDASDIMGQLKNMFEWFMMPMLFPPSVEPPSPEAFISKHPRDFKRSHGLDIPVMIGVNSEEGAMYMTIWESTLDTVAEWNADFDNKLALVASIQNEDPDTIREKLDLMKQTYFPNNQVDLNEGKKLTDFFSDSMFFAGFDEFTKNRLADNTKSADTFVYLFSHRGEASFNDIIGLMFGVESVKDYGVCHADDLLYLFPMNEVLLPTLAPTKLDRKVQSIMTQMWVNFAKNGNPTPKNSDLGFDWKQTKEYPLKYLRVGNYNSPDESLFGMEEGLYEERVNLWREINSIGAETKPVKTEL